MKRWSRKESDEIENEAIDKFLEEIKEVCIKHGLSISHEDGQGGFIIQKYDEFNIDWLFSASDDTE